MRVDVSDAAWAQETSNGWQKAVGQNVVWFSDEPVKNEAKTLEAGRPIFDSVLFVHIRCPGDKLVEIDRKATNIDREKYSRELEAFRRKQDVRESSGTPLEMWPLLDRRQVAEFKAMNIYSVEHLANLNEQQGAKIMGFNKLREKAQNFLKAAQGQANFDAMAEEARKKDEIILQLQERMERLEANQKKKPGRKPKEVE